VATKRKQRAVNARREALRKKALEAENRRLKRELAEARKRAREVAAKAARERAKRAEARRRADARKRASKAKAEAPKPDKGNLVSRATPVAAVEAVRPKWQPIPAVRNGLAHPKFRAKKLLAAVMTTAASILASKNESGYKLHGPVADKTDPDFVDYYAYLTPSPRITFADIDSDVRALALHDAFNRLATSAPWGAIVGPTSIPRGVAFYGSLTVVDTALRKDMIGGSDVEQVKLKSGKISQTAKSWDIGNALNVYNEWLRALQNFHGYINDDARTIKIRFHIRVPLISGIEGIRRATRMTDEEWFKAGRRDVGRDRAATRTRLRNPREH